MPSDASPTTPRRKRVLFLTHRLPYPPDRGDRIRSYHMLKTLSEHFDVGLASVSEEPVWLQHHHVLRASASRVALQPIIKSWSSVRAGLAFLGGRPITPAWHYRIGLVDQILQWHETDPFDAILTFCTGMIDYARALQQHQQAHGKPLLPHILDLVDVDSMKWDAYADVSRFPLSLVYRAEARRLRRIESGRFDPYHAVTVISPAEAKAYRQTVGEHAGLHVVRNGVDLDYFSPQPDPHNHTLVFVGVLNYRPNTEGVTWFARNVMPLLRERLPDAHFFIVGRNPTAAVLELSAIPGVEVVGSVPDVRAYLAQSSLAIAPLLLARGTQNKVLEAMACQKAVVCSPAAAGGIDAVPGEHFALADTPSTWAATLVELMTNSTRRHTLAAAGHKLVTTQYAWNQAMQPMVQLLQNAVDSPAASTPSPSQS